MTSSTVTKPASPAADTDPVASPAATPERTTVHWYRSRSAILRLALLAFVITLAWAAYCYRFSPHQFIDLDVYRLGVQAWWHGHNMYGTLPPTNIGTHLPFIYPPFAVLVLGPLAWVPWASSVVCMMALSLFSLGLVIYLTVCAVWPSGGRRGAVVATSAALPLALSTEPVWDTLWFGQVNLLLMGLVALDCLVTKPKWPRGVLVGIALAVKLTPAVFLLFFLLRKDYRAALTGALTGALATAIGFAIDWSGSMKFWFGASGGARSVSGSKYIDNQTIDGGLARLGLPKSEQTVLWVALSAIVLVIAVLAIRRAFQAGSPALAMVATAGAGLVISPTSWGHHWVYVVPAVIVMVAEGLRRRQVNWLIAGAVTAVLFHIAPFSLPYRASSPWAITELLRANSFTIACVILLVMLAVSSPIIGDQSEELVSAERRSS